MMHSDPTTAFSASSAAPFATNKKCAGPLNPKAALYRGTYECRVARNIVFSGLGHLSEASSPNSLNSRNELEIRLSALATFKVAKKNNMTVANIYVLSQRCGCRIIPPLATMIMDADTHGILERNIDLLPSVLPVSKE